MRVIQGSMGAMLCCFIVCAGTDVSAGECTLYQGGALWLENGPVEGSDLLVQDGKLEVLSSGSVAPEGCELYDASGKIITPGLIEGYSRLGLVEVELEASTVDASPGEEWGDSTGVHASFRVVEGYNPRSTAIPVTRVEGVTSTVIFPGGGWLSGQSGWVDLAGGSQAETVQNISTGMGVHLGAIEGSRAVSLHRLRLLLSEAERFRRVEKKWAEGKTGPFRFPGEELRAMYPVLDGKIPLVVFANRASDLEALASFTREKGLRTLVVGGAEAWIVRELLRDTGISVLLDPLLFSGRSFDEIHGRADNASLLVEAGVRVLIGTFETHNARTLRQVAGNAVREGLSREDAMRAITSSVAEVYGMKGYGVLQSGAKANIVVWNGDPFELSTWAERVVIGGNVISLETRQTRLRDRYLKKPEAKGSPGP